MLEDLNETVLYNKIITLRNGEVLIKEATKKDVAKFTYVKSICESCTNEYADRCKKVSHPNKSYISSYPFITSADQITDDKGEVQYFYVNECVNYRIETPEERRFLKELAYKQNMKMLYGAKEDYARDKEINKEIQFIENEQIKKIETPYQRSRREAQQRRHKRK